MTMQKQKRGRKGFGGIRIMVHLTEEILKALEVEVERQKDDRVTRAELIRRALEAQYLGKRRKSDWKPPKQ